MALLLVGGTRTEPETTGSCCKARCDPGINLLRTLRPYGQQQQQVPVYMQIKQKRKSAFFCIIDDDQTTKTQQSFGRKPKVNCYRRLLHVFFSISGQIFDFSSKQGTSPHLNHNYI